MVRDADPGWEEWRMLRKVLVQGSFLVALVALGCSNPVGNDGAQVGGACTVASDCHPNARCLTGEAWPGGYCATACDSDADCPDGSVCAQTDMGVCLVACAGDGECRSNYSCLEWEARGAAGTVRGCGFTD